MISNGCSKSEDASRGAGAAAPAKESAPPAARVTSAHFALELKPNDACKVGAECVATVDLTALGGYHINKEYPYRFTAGLAKGLEYLGKDAAGPGVFSKAAGDFAEPSETRGVLTVRFRPTQAGAAQVAGSYKFSVCSDQNCQIETAELVATLDAKP